jgi:hypothetical protein
LSLEEGGGVLSIAAQQPRQAEVKESRSGFVDFLLWNELEQRFPEKQCLEKFILGERTELVGLLAHHFRPNRQVPWCDTPLGAVVRGKLKTPRARRDIDDICETWLARLLTAGYDRQARPPIRFWAMRVLSYVCLEADRHGAQLREVGGDEAALVRAHDALMGPSPPEGHPGVHAPTPAEMYEEMESAGVRTAELQRVCRQECDRLDDQSFGRLVRWFRDTVATAGAFGEGDVPREQEVVARCVDFSRTGALTSGAPLPEKLGARVRRVDVSSALLRILVGKSWTQCAQLLGELNAGALRKRYFTIVSALRSELGVEAESAGEEVE